MNKLNQKHMIAFETVFSKEDDITFVIKRLYHDNQVAETEDCDRIEKCIGFYHGEPDARLTDSVITKYYLTKTGMIPESEV